MMMGKEKEERKRRKKKKRKRMFAAVPVPSGRFWPSCARPFWLPRDFLAKGNHLLYSILLWYAGASGTVAYPTLGF